MTAHNLLRSSVAIAALIMSCSLALAGKPKTVAAIAQTAPATDDNVIVFREYAQPTVFSASIKVDGKKIGGLGQRSYLSFKTTPGAHLIRMSWPLIAAHSGADFPLVVEPNKTHYIEITASVTGESGSTVKEISATDAAFRIKNCCTYKPLGTK